MSRADKAKAEKKAAKRRSRIILLAIGLIVIGVGAASYFSGSLPLIPGAGSKNLIDENNSFSRIDFFGNTYVYVFIEADRQVSGVTVNEQPMAFNPHEGRWELVLLGLTAGDELTILAYTDSDLADQAVLVVEELTLDDD